MTQTTTPTHRISLETFNTFDHREHIAGESGKKALVLHTWIEEGYVMHTFEVYGPTSKSESPKAIFTSRMAKEALAHYNNL